MNPERDKEHLPPDDVDEDEDLDAYDEELAESFPASDPPSGAQPKK
ncbi:MAG: hypothetical protein ACREMT_05355 [Vulcanimicrobiaceae bacterium]